MSAARDRQPGGRQRSGAERAVELNGSGAAGAPGTMDLEFLKGLIEAVDRSGIDSLEIHRAGTRIRIAKTPPPAPTGSAAAVNMPAAAVATPAASPVAALPTPNSSPAPVAESAAEATPKTNLVEVKSPMVGTFYRAPAPEAPPYVEVGSVVSKGQTLCILEAMKLMNELEAELDGTIREILADNADPIEFGQVLFRIEPTGSR
jgi:acetyl-CoA carboxylase biotin carboxyl carrier protein